MEGVQTLDQLLRAGLRGRTVFVRADLNVPLRAGLIRDESRIRASLPTLERLCAAGAKVVVASHLGRPGGKFQPDLSLEPVAHRIEQLLARPVRFVKACVGDEALASVAAMTDGEILLLENLRFEPGETRNDPDLARGLSRLADRYVFDAFGSAHRAHASTVGIQKDLTRRAAGELLQRELSRLEALRDPARPFVCVLGGAKVKSKAKLLEALIQRADVVALAGALAYPFLDALGHCVGNSPVEPELRGTVDYVLAALDRTGCQLLLPTDHLVLHDLAEDVDPRVVSEIPVGCTAVDIGPETSRRYADAIASAASVFWNGPIGIFELPGCGRGTEEIAHAVARCAGYTVVGGGDTVGALRLFGVEDGPDHVSSGGGAALAFVAGEPLPALEALRGSQSHAPWR